MDKTSDGNYTKLRVSNLPFNKNSPEYIHYKNTIPTFGGEAVYVYSFKEEKIIYANGWFNLLGYEDQEITLLKIVSITTPRFSKFTNELNDKALQFLKTKSEDLEKYSFTLETEKIHKNGEHIPLFSRIGILKSEGGKVTEIIGISQVIKSIKIGEIMQFAAYGPTEVEEFEDSISKELFNHFVISRKEKEALQLAAKGMAFKEIAASLGVSQSAIEKRIIPMYKRFGVSSLPHLVNFAHINHIL